MRSQRFKLSMSLFVMTAMVPLARAQQQTPDQAAPPIPAYHSPFASAADNGGDQDPGTLAPDTRSLSGAQNFSLGELATAHSYWQPFVNVSTVLDSNPNEGSGGGWTTWTSISGGVNLDRKSGISDMKLNYLGGGMLSNSGTSSNGIIQTLNFVDTLSFRRTTLTFIDSASYLPEAQFGFGGLGGESLPTGGSLNSGFVPSQSILTPRGQDLTNSSVIEVTRLLTARSSVTLVGGYSLLHYFDTGDGLLNYGDAIFQGGYNYQLSKKDTIALSYGFSAFRYSNSVQLINSNSFSVSYGRRVTGRLAFHVSAGPQLVYSRVSLSGSPQPTNSSTTGQFYWSAQTALQYQLHRAQLGVTYYHGVTGGSGVLAGSEADTVTGTASQQLSRTTTGLVNFGYSHNSGANLGLSVPSNQTYGYWFGGANISRQLGRSLNVSLSYQAQYQQLNTSSCAGSTCGTDVIRNLISFGVGWKKQPIPLE